MNYLSILIGYKLIFVDLWLMKFWFGVVTINLLFISYFASESFYSVSSLAEVDAGIVLKQDNIDISIEITSSDKNLEFLKTKDDKAAELSNLTVEIQTTIIHESNNSTPQNQINYGILALHTALITNLINNYPLCYPNEKPLLLDPPRIPMENIKSLNIISANNTNFNAEEKDTSTQEIQIAPRQENYKNHHVHIEIFILILSLFLLNIGRLNKKPLYVEPILFESTKAIKLQSEKQYDNIDFDAIIDQIQSLTIYEKYKCRELYYVPGIQVWSHKRYFTAKHASNDSAVFDLTTDEQEFVVIDIQDI
eukprot:NODE_30_length_37342_cov_0.449507.p14 type:complete len:308 gc:universal NODE_30_length_37342_cov_0.449507:12359-11436(-)